MRKMSPALAEHLGKVAKRALEAKAKNDGRPFVILHLITAHCMCKCASCLWKRNDWEDVPAADLKRFYREAKAEGGKNRRRRLRRATRPALASPGGKPEHSPFCSFPFPELGNQDRQEAVQVLDHADLREVEDGGAGIGVNGHDQLGAAHAHTVLNSAGDAAG